MIFSEYMMSSSRKKENDYSGNSISKSTKDRYDYNKRLLQDFQDYYKLKLRLGNFDDKIYNKFFKILH